MPDNADNADTDASGDCGMRGKLLISVAISNNQKSIKKSNNNITIYILMVYQEKKDVVKLQSDT
jgi:hypothetical protein